MDQELQPIPPGLLSLLELKAKGKAPGVLGGTVVPTIELFDWFGLDQRTVVDGIDNTSIASGTRFLTLQTFNTTPLTVPDGEVWRVHDYSVTLQMPADTSSYDVQQFCSAILRRQVGTPGGQSGRFIGPSTFTTPYTPGPTLGSGQVLISPSLRDFWANPGDRFAFYFAGAHLSAGASPSSVAGVAYVTRLKL